MVQMRMLLCVLLLCVLLCVLLLLLLLCVCVFPLHNLSLNYTSSSQGTNVPL